VLIGTAAALRIYPIVLLLPLAAAGRWRVLGVAIATAAGWVALGVVVAGPDATRTFIELLVTLQGVDAGSSSLAADGPARVVAVVAGLALLVGGGWAVRSADGAIDELLAWALALGGMLLVTPVVWDHYTTTLLPLVVAIVAATGLPALGLLSAAMLPASLSGGYILAWLPLIGVLAAARRRARAAQVESVG
jgi:alpha-1,2-mannosyltransferase